MKALRFLHIPKTAGSTFTDILRMQYAGKQIFHFAGDGVEDKKAYHDQYGADDSKVMLFTGHAPMFTGIDRADQATIITVLRDPVSRVKSFCQHVSEGKTDYLLPDFAPESFNLDAFLASGNPELSNLHSKMLINHDSCTDSALIDAMSVASARDAALDNLYHRITHFGLQEYFDESLMIFANALEWKPPFYVSENRKNTKKQLVFQPHHIERIAELNAIDIEVYASARAKFEEILASDKFDHAQLARFRQFNRPASMLIKQGKKIIRKTRSVFRR